MKRILVVEEDRALADLVRAHLEEDGFAADVAESKPEDVSPYALVIEGVWKPFDTEWLDGKLERAGLKKSVEERTLEHVAFRLKSLRAEQGLTLEGVGKAAKLGTTTISEYERGRIIPSLQSLIKLARVFSVRARDLLPEK